MMFPIDYLLIGSVACLGDRGARSGIDKRPSHEPLLLSFDGLAQDGQADRRFHGGPQKALHQYPREHYEAWRQEGKAPQTRLSPGGFGENLSTLGLSERDVSVGDIFSLGEAIIQVSQGRQPCWKLNLRFGHPDMSARVQASGRIGWYYRVLREGRVAAGDTLMRLERRAPEWTIERLWRLLYVAPLDRVELEAMTAADALPASWRAIAAERLRSNLVEDWRPRLNTPADFSS